MGDQPCEAAVGIEGVNGFAQLGVAKAEGGLAVFQRNIGVDGVVILDKQGNVWR